MRKLQQLPHYSHSNKLTKIMAQTKSLSWCVTKSLIVVPNKGKKQGQKMLDKRCWKTTRLPIEQLCILCMEIIFQTTNSNSRPKLL